MAASSIIPKNAAARKVALVMGVANQRSIAWAVCQSFLAQDYDCLVTFQTKKHQEKSQTLLLSTKELDNTNSGSAQILGSFACNVTTDIPVLFNDYIPETLGQNRKIDAIVHSIAYADFEGQADKLSQASLQAFLQAQHVSAYSFLETAQCAIGSGAGSDNNSSVLAAHSSLTALTYLGAVRAVPNYHVMGPAKASLEAIVRGLAAELGPTDNSIRVNAVSAGPLKTAAARGIPDFGVLANHCNEHAPTGNPTVQQVADTVTWVAGASSSSGGGGVTGQTIYVDGGYSSVVPVSTTK